MIKVVGAGLIIGSCTLIGFRIARDFRERPRQLRSLLHSLRLLQSEIEYSVTPLPQALAEVAKRSQPPVDVVFQKAAEAIAQGDASVAEALEAGIQACQDRAALRTQDFDVLREFGKTLGVSDRIHQTQHFAVAISHLSGLEKEARESQLRHERLWQYVGVLTGLLLVVLLY
jgi:stage III sporulation protein AB